MSEADAIKKEARLVTIRDGTGVEIKGTFLYLRDFGGALVVYELSEDKKRVSGVRIIKQGNYSSYTLQNQSAKQMPVTVAVSPVAP